MSAAAPTKTIVATQKTAAPPGPRAGSGLETVRLRNEFYRDGYRAAQTTNVLLAAVLLASVLGNIYQSSRPPPAPQYFATTPSGSLLPMTPLDDPLLSPNQLANWVQDAVTSSFTLDAKNYVKQIAHNQDFYLPEGFEQYKAALSESGQIKLIKEKLMITSVVANGVPVVVDSARTRAGTLMWKMQMPVSVEYTSAKEHYLQRLVVNLVVSRRPTTESAQGVGISQLVAKPEA